MASDLQTQPRQNGQTRALIVVTPEIQERLRDPRTVVGWILCAAGAVAVFLGYWGVSGTLSSGKQMPYLVSGGLGGIFLLGLGAAMLFSSDLADARKQIRELKGMVEALDTRLEQPAPLAAVEASANGGPYLALATGSTFHRASCQMLAGKTGALEVNEVQISARGLKPCRLCEPATVS